MGRVAPGRPGPAGRSGPPAYPRTSKTCEWVEWVTEPRRAGPPRRQDPPGTRRRLINGELTLSDGNVGGAGGAGVLGPWPDQPVVAVLLQHVRRPARHAAHGKDR